MTPQERQHHADNGMTGARAIQRRGEHRRLMIAVEQFKAWGDDPDIGAYAQALADKAALEVEMRRAGQEP